MTVNIVTTAEPFDVAEGHRSLAAPLHMAAGPWKTLSQTI